MEKDKVEQRVHEIIREQFALPADRAITRDMDLVQAVGADSIDLMELVMEAEDVFEIAIPDEDSERWKTVGDAVDYIVAKLADADACAREAGEKTDDEA